MEKSTAHTIVTIVTIGSLFAAGAWMILGEIADNGKAIAANAQAIEANAKAIAANAEAIAELRVEIREENAELRAEMKAENAEIRAEIAEIRGLVFSHVTGHQHGISDAGAGDGGEQNPPSN